MGLYWGARGFSKNVGCGVKARGFQMFRVLALPIGAKVVPFGGFYLGSYKGNPKKELLWNLWVKELLWSLWVRLKVQGSGVLGFWVLVSGGLQNSFLPPPYTASLKSQ